ncbi:MAG: hypothetical protein ABIP55_02165 [Tepidisphaeraceae bacterium]
MSINSACARLSWALDELDFLIDRIVFKLFNLTLEEQKLILSRVGFGRPSRPGAADVPPAPRLARGRRYLRHRG